MKPKSRNILFLVFFILLMALIIQFYWEKRKLTTFISKDQKKLLEIKKENLSSLKILTAGEGEFLLIEKKGGDWQLKDKKVVKEKVENLIDGLLDIDKFELISQTSRLHQELELNKEKAISLTIQGSNNQEPSFFIGKQTSLGYYLRFQDSDQVYLVPALAKVDLSINFQDWYDKTIVNFEGESLKSIKLERKNSRFFLDRKEDQWKIRDGETVEKSIMEGLINNLSPLVASSLAEEEDRKNYPREPKFKLEIITEKETVNLNFYQGKTDYLVEKKPQELAFILPNHLAENFFKVRQDFLEKE